MEQPQAEFWSLPATELLQRLQATPNGLTNSEAQKRLSQYSYNLLKPKARTGAFTLLLSQFKSPIIVILLFAAILAFFLHDPTDAIIILAIVLASGLLGFWQEYGAANAVQKLLAMVQVKAAVMRDGSQQEIPVEKIVPGDIVILGAGDVIPADCLILESNDLYVDEVTLTGETYPAEKAKGVLSAETPLSKRTNSLFMGTHVISGSARALVAETGTASEFGAISERLKLRPPETEFEDGVRRFGYFLMEVTLLLVAAIFVINVFLARPILETFLFSLALAVGLTPQLLPAIISVNLAQGAKRMASQKVIVKRLNSIENFGSMNVLCSDKTGTLTEGLAKLHSALDIDHNESQKTLLYAYINAFYQTGYTNPIDEAILSYQKLDIAGYEKLDEVPYDFIRKRLSVLVSQGGICLMITKGALFNVLDGCFSAETSTGTTVDIDSVREKIQQSFEELSSKGFRVLGLAYKNMGHDRQINKDHETGMTFLGFLVFFDPPKSDITETLGDLKQLGVSLKVITGDNKLVATAISQQVGLAQARILSGHDIHQMSDEALLGQVNDVDIFAEVEPNHKERIVLALRKAGNVVGYLGDGINDASALHAADVGISVASAVDVAKDAADIVLLEKGLDVLAQGVRSGRTTFSNTLKYVFMATSANFGNMFSMAGASLFLSFLPLLPKQILLTNLTTDLPEMTIATDNVDTELVQRPRKWNIKFIRKFMLVFGLLSSVFDYLTFGVLLFLLHATETQFRTGWFIESVVSASAIVLVIRSRRPFFKSKPGKYLLMATMLVIVATLVMPFTPLGRLFGFEPLPLWFLGVIGFIVALYIIAAEATKRIFYREARK